MLRVEHLKTPSEIAQMREAGLINWHAHRLAASMIRPGVTTGEINAAIEAFLAEQQTEALFKGVPGRVPFPAATCISINDEVVHGIPKNRALAEGDIVAVDIGNRKNGWCADSALTHLVGRASKEAIRLVLTTKEALKLALEMLPNVDRWSPVAGAMAAFVRQAGYSVVEGYGGHGIGRELHEQPQVPNHLSRQLKTGGDFRLAPGLVFTIEPMVNQGSRRVRTASDHWTITTTDGLPSAHFEHTLAITENGPVVLTAGPQGELF